MPRNFPKNRRHRFRSPLRIVPYTYVPGNDFVETRIQVLPPEWPVVGGVVKREDLPEFTLRAPLRLEPVSVNGGDAFEQRVRIISPQTDDVGVINQTRGYGVRIAWNPLDDHGVNIVNVGAGPIGHPGSYSLIAPDSSDSTLHETINEGECYGKRVTWSPIEDHGVEFPSVGAGPAGHPDSIEISLTLT